MLSVGTLEPRKNLARCIAAFASLPQALRAACPLVIAGGAGWGEALPPSAQSLVAAGELRLTGYVDASVLPYLYGGARLLAYPSIYEGFGLPPLEAMACGVPVIASNLSSLPEVVGDAGLLVDPADERAIAEAMRTLLEDPERASALARAGLERARGFSWRRCAEETLAVYRQAAVST
jgi:alpha-1,3-rhamnosyl/mannosyltransferase